MFKEDKHDQENIAPGMAGFWSKGMLVVRRGKDGFFLGSIFAHEKLEDELQCFAKDTPRCQRTPGHHAREAGENFINVQGG
jgi:hypothetical protein